jgi:chromosome segregation ATPase
MISQLNLYAGIAILLLLGSAYGVYRYQAYTIRALEVKLEESESKVDNLEANITGVRKVIDTFKTNHQIVTREITKLESSVSRLEVIKSKPTLVSKKIQNSYTRFHLEKACYSKNEEACLELNKK